MVTLMLRQTEAKVCGIVDRAVGADPSPPRAGGLCSGCCREPDSLQRVQDQSQHRELFCSTFLVKKSKPPNGCLGGKADLAVPVSPVLLSCALIRTKIPFCPCSQSWLWGSAHAAASMPRSLELQPSSFPHPSVFTHPSDHTGFVGGNVTFSRNVSVFG